MLSVEAGGRAGYTSGNHITIRTLQSQSLPPPWIQTQTLCLTPLCTSAAEEEGKEMPLKAEVTAASGWNWSSSTNCRCWVSPELPHLKPACLSKYPTGVVLIGLCKWDMRGKQKSLSSLLTPKTTEGSSPEHALHLLRIVTPGLQATLQNDF